MEWTPQTVDADQAAELRLVGDFDLYNAPRFCKFALGGIEGGWSGLLLDLAGVGYLDSTGVGVIIRIVQALRRKGAKLRFKGLKGSPRRVLEMSNILPLIEEVS